MKKSVFLILAIIFCAPVVSWSNQESPTNQFIFWVEQKDYVKAKFFLDQGADVNAENKYGMSALAWAARNDDLEGIKKLLSWGAKPELRHQLLICPREEFSEAVRLFLGEVIDMCSCKPPASVVCVGAEGQREKWCSNQEQREGLYIWGWADGCDSFYQIEKAVIYQKGKVVNDVFKLRRAKGSKGKEK